MEQAAFDKKYIALRREFHRYPEPAWLEYRTTARGGVGIKNYGVTEKTGKVVGIKVVDGTEDLLVLTEQGVLLRTDVGTIKSCGRAAQGVIVMRFKEPGDRVISIALAEKEPEEQE